MCLRARFVSSAAGFEGCSMVPSIYPLETLHNSLSLKQVNEFLTSVCESAGDPHTRTSRGERKRKNKTLTAFTDSRGWFLTSSPSHCLQPCPPCWVRTISRRWTRTSLRGSSPPPCRSDLALTDLRGVSIAASFLKTLRDYLQS